MSTSTSSSLSFLSEEAIPSFPSSRQQWLALTIRTILSLIILGSWTYCCHTLFGALIVVIVSLGRGSWGWVFVTSIGLLIGGLTSICLLRFVWKRRWWRLPSLEDDEDEDDWVEDCFGSQENVVVPPRDAALYNGSSSSIRCILLATLRLVFALALWTAVTFAVFLSYVWILRDVEYTSAILFGPYGILAMGNSIFILFCACMFRRYALPYYSDNDDESFFFFLDDPSSTEVPLVTSTIDSITAGHGGGVEEVREERGPRRRRILGYTVRENLEIFGFTDDSSSESPF